MLGDNWRNDGVACLRLLMSDIGTTPFLETVSALAMGLGSPHAQVGKYSNAGGLAAQLKRK